MPYPYERLTRLRDRVAGLLAMHSDGELGAELRTILDELGRFRAELAERSAALTQDFAELAAASDRFARLYHEAPVAYLTLATDGTILRTNGRAARVLGRSPEELAGHGFSALVHPSDRPALQQLMGALPALSPDRPAELEVRLTNARVVELLCQGRRDEIWLTVVDRSSDPQATSGGDPPQTGAILVVDDDERVRRSIQTVLRIRGHSVQAAGSGREALDLITTCPGQFDCVLLDFAMPDWDGLEVLRRLREVDAQVPVVLVSGFSTVATLARFEGLGLTGFIQKPFDVETLVDVVNRTLGRRADPSKRDELPGCPERG